MARRVVARFCRAKKVVSQKKEQLQNTFKHRQDPGTEILVTQCLDCVP